jgi:DNA ligase-1
VRESTGLRLYVDERKMGVLRCLGYGDELMARTFTSDPCETPIHVTPWGFLGESWPYFRPNFTNIEEQRAKYKAEQVGGWVGSHMPPCGSS